MEAPKIVERISTSGQAQPLNRSISSKVAEPEYHTHKCLETRGLPTNESHLQHSLNEDNNENRPEMLTPSRRATNLEIFGKKTKVSKKSKDGKGNTQRIYRKMSPDDHQLSKKATYTLIPNEKYPVRQSKEGNLKGIQIVHPPPSTKPVIGQLAAKTLKRTLDSPFKKPTLLSIHGTQLIGRIKNNETYDNSKPAYLTLKANKESNLPKLTEQRTVTKLASKPIQKTGAAAPTPFESKKRITSLKSTKKSSKTEMITKISPDKPQSGDETLEPIDLKSILQDQFCRHGIFIGPSKEPTPKPSLVSVTVQTLPECQESDINFISNVEEEISSCIYSEKDACPFSSMELNQNGSKNHELKSKTVLVVNLPPSKSCAQTHNTTQYRVKDDAGKHYIIPTKYKARHNREKSLPRQVNKKQGKNNKSIRKRCVSHGCLSTKSSSHSTKKAVSLNPLKKRKASKPFSKRKRGNKSVTSVKSCQTKRSKFSNKKIVPSERLTLSQSGCSIRSRSEKRRISLKQFNPVFSHITPKTSKHNKSDTKASCSSSSSKNAIDTQNSETTFSHKNNVPPCCVIWGWKDKKKRDILPPACKSKVKTGAGSARKRKTFSANFMKRRRGFLKTARSLLPNSSSTKSPNNRLMPRLPLSAAEALSSKPGRVVVRGQDPPYALRRLLAASGPSALSPTPMQLWDRTLSWSEELLALERTLLGASIIKEKEEEEEPPGMLSMTTPLQLPKKNPLSSFLPGSVPGCPIDFSTAWSSKANALRPQDNETNGSIAWARWAPIKRKSQQPTGCDASTSTISNNTHSSFHADKATSASKATSVGSNPMLVARSTSMTAKPIVDAAVGPSTQFVSKRLPVVGPTTAVPPPLPLTTSRSVPSPKLLSPAPRSRPGSPENPSHTSLIYPLFQEHSSAKCLNALTRVHGFTDIRRTTIRKGNVCKEHICLPK